MREVCGVGGRGVCGWEGWGCGVGGRLGSGMWGAGREGQVWGVVWEDEKVGHT